MTYRLTRLVEKLNSSGRELADEDPSDSPSIYPTKDDVVVVGFDEDIRQMMDRITPCTSYPGLQILPIVGMAGIDDVWSAEAWAHVKSLLPDNEDRSRIILTTTLMDVATYATSSWNPVHMMRFLDDEQSWRLKELVAERCLNDLIGQSLVYRSYVRLPVEIWSLGQLRHLIAFSFQPLPLPERVTLSLVNLQTLSMAIDFECSVKMVKMIPNIKKLGICYSGTRFDNLIHLDRVEKLKLEMHGSYVPLLVNVVEQMQSFEMFSSDSYSDYYKHATLRTHAPLLLYASRTEGIRSKALYRTLPHLGFQCLMLHRCPYLDEIPNDIADIPTLNQIEIDDHNQSLLYSGQKYTKGTSGKFWGMKS
ncbi:hypothetical protein SASPL_106272 [Salvia splendens]|uniref:NB-ARC domain-containing protein n=1 Tax=Salvia splendens TaxID=180675 RepID=A0A8X8YNA7_SALSN|nr:hypothetical protein SASPL_106272 [Salvia splendens]